MLFGYSELDFEEVEQVRYTNASRFKQNEFVGILSYGRICAFKDLELNEVYIVRGLHDYSTTTSRHVNEWAVDMGFEEISNTPKRRKLERKIEEQLNQGGINKMGGYRLVYEDTALKLLEI